MRQIDLTNKIASVIREQEGIRLNDEQIQQLAAQFLAHINLLSSMIMMKCHFTNPNTGMLCESDLDLFVSPLGTFLKCRKYPDDHYQQIT